MSTTAYACPACSRTIGETATCVARPGLITFNAERSYLIERGADWARGEWPPRCRDCGIGPDGYHHRGCCVAWCATCNGQRLCCPCDAAADSEQYPPLHLLALGMTRPRLGGPP
jgi:hypothetical protein